MRIAFFGSSLVSAYWNGAATYYRGIVRALQERGHSITFYEPNAYGRQEHRDIEDPPWAAVHVYAATKDAAYRALEQARDADLIVKASGVGVFDDLLEAEVLRLKTSSNLIVFWDVDAPATLERISRNPRDPFIPLVPRYDAIFTYGGGNPVVRGYADFGAKTCVPIYNALDPETHHPVPSDTRYYGDLAFLGNRLPDREARVDEFFFKPAWRLPYLRFLLGGAGWGDKALSPNMAYVDHVYTRDHNAFNCTPRAVLNVSRESMARYGFSPATRVFEAAGAAACIISDWWEGVEMFLEPDKEILTARNGEEVIERIQSLDWESTRLIGSAARNRVLAEHTYNRRAEQIEAVLDCVPAATVGGCAT